MSVKLHQVQAHVVGLINAVSALADFGEPLTYSHFLDDVATQALIAERLRTVGVVIEVGNVEADRADDRSGRGVAADASFDVFIAESPKVAHSPSQDELRKAVIEAVTAQGDPYTPRVEFRRSESARSEQGYVLQIITFTLRVTIP